MEFRASCSDTYIVFSCEGELALYDPRSYFSVNRNYCEYDETLTPEGLVEWLREKDVTLEQFLECVREAR